MGPSRGDTICGNVVVEALGPMHFGALALGPIHLARSPTEPKMWLATIERTLLPRSVDVSRFMAGVADLATREITGAVPIVLVDREADFCVVGYRVMEGARTLAAIAEEGVDDAAAARLARQLAQTLGELHQHGAVHGFVTPTTVIHDGTRWWTWEYGIAGLCTPDRLAPRLRPLGGDVAAPELRAGGEVSPAADVYGWATAVACLLTGSSGSDAVATLQDGETTDPLRELVRACLDPIPELRPRDANVLTARLNEVFGPAPVPERRAPSASESSEFSFAELNEPLPVAVPRPSDTHEIVELLSLDDEPHESLPEGGPDTSGEHWRELAEQYLSPEPTPTDQRPAPTAAELEQVSATDRRSVEALGRVALVRTRVRSGSHKPLPMDHVCVAGEFEMSEEPDPEPEPSAYPRAAEGARELPLGGPEEEEWEDPDAAVFDLDSPGTPRVEVGEHDVDPDPDPDPSGELEWPASAGGDDHRTPWSEPTPVDGLGTRRQLAPRIPIDDDEPVSVTAATLPPAPAASEPRVDPLARTEPPPADPICLVPDVPVRREDSVPRLPLVETPPVAPARARPTSSDSIPAIDRAPSRPGPKLDRTPSRPIPIPANLPAAHYERERSGAWMAWSIALLAGVIAIGATLAAARERGGLSRLLGGTPPAVDDGGTAPADPGADPKGTQTSPAPAPHTDCPATTRPIEGTRVCIDEAEAPGLGEIPSTRVSLVDARAACVERGARLCTPQQWRAACRGARNWRHPYGARGESDRCNGAAPSGAVVDLSRTGARDGCVTPTGVYDLEGNVGEWVDDGSVLGGDSSTRAPSCDSRIQPEAGSASPSTGFRCCLSLADKG